MLNVVCEHSISPVYSVDYVRKLREAVSRNLSVPHTFYCIALDPDLDYGSDVTVIPYTKYDSRISDTKAPYGWRTKLEMFKPGRFSGQVLNLDQDIFITKSIDFLAGYVGDFLALKDQYLGGIQGSVLSWTPGPLSDSLYETLFEPGVWDRVAKYQLFDQEYITEQLARRGITPDYIQDLFPGKAVSYKNEYMQFSHDATLVDKAAIVYCHGIPKPHEIQDEVLRRHW